MTDKITDEILGERLKAVTDTTASYPESFNAALALELADYSAAGGWIDFRYRARRDHLNPYGGLHGGIIASLVDNCGGAGACAFSGAYVSTAALSVEYLVAMNKPSYTIHVEFPHVGSRIVNTMVKIKEEKSGTVCASGIASFAVVSREAMPKYREG